jgi:hypothetical protein
VFDGKTLWSYDKGEKKWKNKKRTQLLRDISKQLTRDYRLVVGSEILRPFYFKEKHAMIETEEQIEEMIGSSGDQTETYEMKVLRVELKKKLERIRKEKLIEERELQKKLKKLGSYNYVNGIITFLLYHIEQ